MKYRIRSKSPTTSMSLTMSNQPHVEVDAQHAFTQFVLAAHHEGMSVEQMHRTIDDWWAAFSANQQGEK